MFSKTSSQDLGGVGPLPQELNLVAQAETTRGAEGVLVCPLAPPSKGQGLLQSSFPGGPFAPPPSASEFVLLNPDWELAVALTLTCCPVVSMAVGFTTLSLWHFTMVGIFLPGATHPLGNSSHSLWSGPPGT